MKEYSRILVTGGAGFIGSHLVDRLMKDGYKVVVLDNFFSGNLENIKHHLESGKFCLVKGDVRNSDIIKETVRNVDAVFHLAAIVSVPLSIKKPLLVNDVNVRGTLNLLEASSKADVKRFIYISSCAVYGEANRLPIDESCPTNPVSPYAVSKLAAEHYCKVFHENYGLNTVCLRYFNVYGPRQAKNLYSGVIIQFIDRLKQGKPPVIYGDGEQTRDFVHVKDIVEANMLALNSQRSAGHVINVGSSESTTINNLANLLMEFFDQTHLKPVHRAPREGDIRNSYADIAKAEKMLGYKPKIKLKEGISVLLKSQCEVQL
ncbi:MAG: SDR family oxidoreductase [Candidatus Bathyarchaeota archaeon]|nr:SDR family oxidoreductase [Candidatus Bathyarchaeota archaeon]MDH5745867.1 SDR family oxidoreductase [Candidatus Bathyarchaeota archaeon]